MKLRREARSLKAKAASSLRIGLEAFNGFSEDGRTTTTLLHLQHACEMLLKACLVQRQINIQDPHKGHSVGFKKCLSLAREHCGFTESQAGVFRAVDSLRDGEQHWLITVPEDVLFIHARGLVTAIDEILAREFHEKLADHLPTRVLPVSTMPEAQFDILVDRECKLIKQLLAPGRRQRDEARGRIRTLLSMEAHVADEVEISERDITRVEKALKGNKSWGDVLPRLKTMQTNMIGTTVDLKVHITKNQGIPIYRIAADDPTNAAAVREVDLRKKYRYTPTELAQKLGLNTNQSKTLREMLKIDDDPAMCHIFEFGKSKHPCYSDQAISLMKERLSNPEFREGLKSEVKRKMAASGRSRRSMREAPVAPR
jgi:hypothetical protein